MREGDTDHCLNCNGRIVVILLWTGLTWVHERTMGRDCPPLTVAIPQGHDTGR